MKGCIETDSFNHVIQKPAPPAPGSEIRDWIAVNGPHDWPSFRDADGAGRYRVTWRHGGWIARFRPLSGNGAPQLIGTPFASKELAMFACGEHSRWWAQEIKKQDAMRTVLQF